MRHHLYPSGFGEWQKARLVRFALMENARVERAAGGDYGHLLPAADSISICVLPQLAAQHGRARKQTPRSSVGGVERLIVLAQLIEHTGLIHQSFDFVRPLSG